MQDLRPVEIVLATTKINILILLFCFFFIAYVPVFLITAASYHLLLDEGSPPKFSVYSCYKNNKRLKFTHTKLSIKCSHDTSYAYT